MSDQQNPSMRSPLGLFIGLDRDDPRQVDKLRFVEALRSIGKGLDEGTRKASEPMKGALLAGTEAGIKEMPHGVTSIVSHLAKERGAALGFKLSTYDDGSLAFSTMGVAANLRDMAAIVDMMAAALAEIDSHSMQNDWAATHRPSTATPN